MYKEFHDSIDNSVDWFSNYKKDEIPNISSTLDDLRRKAKNIDEAINKKTAIGFYGESQVGKSYLVSSILPSDSDTLKVSGNQNNDFKDFLKNYNPTRNTEATAMVTRFTKDIDCQESQYMKIELLSLSDIMISLHWGFMTEVKHDNILDTFISNQLDAIKSEINNSTSSDIISSDVAKDFIDDFGHYLSNLEASYSCRLLDDRVRKAGREIHTLLKKTDNLTLDLIVKVSSLFWYGSDMLSEFYRNLIETWLRIGGSSPCYLSEKLVHDALDMEYLILWSKGSQSKAQNIKISKIDNSIFLDADNQNSDLDLAYIQILTREIKFYVQNDSPILNTVDALDFPGVKPERPIDERINVNNINDFNTELENLINLIKAGKLRHLFISYMAKREIPFLVICDAGENTNMTTLASHVKDWAHYKKSHSENTLPLTLFFAMTKSDILLKDELSLDAANDRLTTRFTTQFKHKFKDTLEMMSEGEYKNVFLIRNPNAAQINFAETNTNNHQVSFINDNVHTSEFIMNPEIMWNELVSSDGGMNYFRTEIVNRLNDLPNEKEDYLKDEFINSCYKILKSRLEIFYHPIDEIELMQQRKKDAKEFVSQINTSFENIANLLIEIERNYPKFGNIHLEEQTGFLPAPYMAKAVRYKDDVLNAFKINLLDSLEEIQNTLTDDIKSESLAQFIEIILNDLSTNNESLINHLRNNESIYKNFRTKTLKIMHESIKWISINWIQNLGKNRSLLSPNITQSLSDDYPHKHIINHWEDNLHNIYCGQEIDVDIDASKTLNTILEVINKETMKIESNML